MTETSGDATAARLPAAERAYGWVKDRVQRLEVASGTFISEPEVAAAVGISRTPVREAFARLAAEHLLTLVPRRGALVAPVSPREVRDVMEARGTLELFAAQRVVEQGIALGPALDRALAEQRRVSNSGDVEAFIALDRAFHLVFVAGAGNAVVAELYGILRDRQHRLGVAAVHSGPNRTTEVLAEHQAIREALVAGNTTAAETAVRHHLARTLDVIQAGPLFGGGSKTEAQP